MPVAAKRRREIPEVRRSQILEAAKRCFRSLGFQASTVDRIAAEAKVSVGLLYRFFASKSAIVEAIIVQEAEAQLQQATAAVENIPAAEIQASLAVANRMAANTFDRDRIALMLEIAAEVSRNPGLQSFVRSKYLQTKKVLAEKLVRKGMDKATAHRVVTRLELITAIASGAALHITLYSDAAPESSPELMARLINAVAQVDP
jgi:AcrR family transcriptional regulator